MLEPVPADQVEDLVESLSYQDKCRVLTNVLWDVFGTVDAGGGRHIDPERRPDAVDIGALVTGLRQEFWLEDDMEDDEEEDEDEEEEEDPETHDD